MPRLKAYNSKPRGKNSKEGVLEMEMEPLNGRSATSGEAPAEDVGPISALVSGMTNNQKRSTFTMLALALMVGLFLYQIGATVFEETFQVDESGHSEMDHVVKKPAKNFHTTSGSFGGVNNIAHPGGAKAAANGEGLAFEDIIIPESNVGHAIKSLNRPNFVNAWGHYVHDEHMSPYASHLYADVTKEELEERQAKYIEKMKKVREEWGAWNFRDPRAGPHLNTTTPATHDLGRDEANFTSAPYKDLPIDEFLPDTWQADEEYVANFLDEAKKLVKRVTEGIYAEVGWPVKADDAEYMENREKFFKIHVWDDPEDAKGIKAGIASIQSHAFEGLVKKLLHAMMTNDVFYAVLGGHSAAAGHGNDFQQNRIITFHHMMEPVFDKLGMKLISRNMGMGGVGTLQFTLAGGDLYGETDILEWDSGMTERGPPVDLFNKQAILSGERVPIIMTDQLYDIMAESNGTAWMGTYVPKNENNIFPETTYENCKEQTYAARWFNEKEEKYNAVCWVPRTDFEPKQRQKDHPGSQVGWHPGNRQHQWKGRKLALVILEALRVAFQRWEDGVAQNGCPLEASHWHVGDSYKVIRENLRTHVNTPKPGEKEDEPRSACEKMYPWLPRICRVQMHGFGMWAPRAHVDYDFLNIIHSAPNGYIPDYPITNVYHGFDLLPPNQEVPDGEIDVHAIAIATTSPPPDIDHSYIDDETSTENGDLTGTDGVVDASETVPPTRRWLREASELGFRKAAELFPPSTVIKQRRLVPEEEENAKQLPSSPDNLMLRRQLEAKDPDATDAADADSTTEADSTDAIVPGRGWEVGGWNPIKAFCDGSAQSECSRHEGNDCMINGVNDKHMQVQGNSLSGWLVFTVPKVREGIILLRMEWWCGQHGKSQLITKDWTEVNNGMTGDTTPWNKTAHRDMMDASMYRMDEEDMHRLLKEGPDTLVPKDLKFDYVVNGVKRTMDRDEFLFYKGEASKNCAAWPILDDMSMAEKDWEGEPVEVAVRFRSEIEPRATYCISHVYYA